MQALPNTATMLALFNLGGGEIILILALVLILFGAKQLPDISRGLGRGVFAFRDSTKEVVDLIDGESRDAGRSVGGIFGKRAAQALTPDNHVAELYDPAAFHGERQLNKRPIGTMERARRFWGTIKSFVRAMCGRNASS